MISNLRHPEKGVLEVEMPAPVVTQLGGRCKATSRFLGKRQLKVQGFRSYCKWVPGYMRGALITAPAADIDADVDIRHAFHLGIVITSIPSRY
ncbi:hypothetical protein LA080_015443 [Diaporthe eres]|nr:hypothetical protein LA080_015443 [Diaporthe eres]